MHWYESPVARAALGGVVAGCWFAAWLALGVRDGSALALVGGVALGGAGLLVALVDTRRLAVDATRETAQDQFELQVVERWVGQRRTLILSALGALRTVHPSDVQLAVQIDALTRELGGDPNTPVR